MKEGEGRRDREVDVGMGAEGFLSLFLDGNERDGAGLMNCG